MARRARESSASEQTSWLNVSQYFASPSCHHHHHANIATRRVFIDKHSASILTALIFPQTLVKRRSRFHNFLARCSFSSPPPTIGKQTREEECFTHPNEMELHNETSPRSPSSFSNSKARIIIMMMMSVHGEERKRVIKRQRDCRASHLRLQLTRRAVIEDY